MEQPRKKTPTKTKNTAEEEDTDTYDTATGEDTDDRAEEQETAEREDMYTYQ